MRRIAGLLLLTLLGLPARANEPPAATAPSPHPTHLTWQQHFAQANTAHDGHLTLDEAKGGYATIAKHFGDIDADHKGYVTENDVRAWHVMRRAARRLTQPREGESLTRPAMQRGTPAQRPINARATRLVDTPEAGATGDQEKD